MTIHEFAKIFETSSRESVGAVNGVFNPLVLTGKEIVMKNLSRIPVLGATLALFLASSVPTLAADSAPSIVVKYNDLNLATADGASQLYSRLKKASIGVCQRMYSPGPGNLTEQVRCRSTVLEAAVKDANEPLLTALHRSTTVELTASR